MKTLYFFEEIPADVLPRVAQSYDGAGVWGDVVNSEQIKKQRSHFII